VPIISDQGEPALHTVCVANLYNKPLMLMLLLLVSLKCCCCCSCCYLMLLSAGV
jgi:hypothetical protein